MEYFNKCGTEFEQATILNNLSVIQIWNGKKTYKIAEVNLKRAIKIFEKINSNEVFEAYYNFGVLCFLRGFYEDAIRYFQLALEEVPTILKMDVALIELNKKISECALDNTKINDLEKLILSNMNEHEIMQDPWVRFQLEYNLRQIELYMKGTSKICPSKEYLPEYPKANTSITVFDNIKVDSGQIPICLSLSPNWRY